MSNRGTIQHGSPLFALVEHAVLDDYSADEISPHTLAVYVALMAYADVSGRAFPSIKNLAARAHVGETACKNAIAKLIDLGLLTKEPQVDPETGESTSNLYTIYRPSSVVKRLPGVAKRPTPVTTRPTGGSPDDPGGVVKRPLRRTSEEEPTEEEPSKVNFGPDGPTGDDQSDPGRDRTDPTPSLPYQILETVCTVFGTTPGVFGRAALGKQLAIAKRLGADGMTIEEAGALATWLESQSWLTGGVDMVTIERYLPRWRMSAAKRDGSYVTLGDGRRGQDESYWFGRKDDDQ